MEREIERETEREERSEGGREMEGEMPSLKRHHWMRRYCYMPRRCHITVLGMFFPFVLLFFLLYRFSGIRIPCS